MKAPHATFASPAPIETATDAEPGQSCDREAGDGRRDHDVQRLRCDRSHELRDVVRVANRRREETVGARIGERDESVERFAQRIGMPDVERFAATGQHDGNVRRVDRCSRGGEPLESHRSIVERLRRVAARVLDRQSRHAGPHARAHVREDAFGVVGVPRLEVRVHRERGGRDDPADVAEHVLRDERRHRVGTPATERESGGRGRQRLEPELCEEARAPDVPGVRHDEAAGLVEASKGENGRGRRSGKHAHS